MSEELKKQVEAISHESMPGANSASRIGEALSAIVDELDEVACLSRDSIKNSNEFLNEYLDKINDSTSSEASIVEKLKSTLNSKATIKQAIEEKGVDMSDDPQLSEYVNRINNIDGYGTWTPNPTWWDIKSIIQDSNNQEYTYKTIQLLLAASPITTFTGGIAYKTSDGNYYTDANATHTWDLSKDKQCVEDGENTYKTRWVITYHSSPDINMNYISRTCLYFIMDGVLPTVAKFGHESFDASMMLHSFEMINGADFTSVTDFSYMFVGCTFLKSIPQIDTSNGITFIGMFGACISLKTIPQIDTSKGEDFAMMFGYCWNINDIPSLNTSKGENFENMFEQCSSLIFAPQLDTSNGTNFQFMFSSCYRLNTIPPLDTSKGIYFNHMFDDCINLTSISSLDLLNSHYDRNPAVGYTVFKSCQLLEKIKIYNLSEELNLSDCNILNYESLMFLINNLTRVSSATLTLGKTNLAKLSSTEKAIATNKGWTLA